MTKFVGTPLRGTAFSTVADEAISTRVNGDVQARIRIDAGGKITWSSGAAAGDTNLYRADTNTLITDDVFKALSGVITLATSGSPTVALDDGALAVDTTNDIFYFRSNGSWNQVTGGGGGATVTVSDTAPESPSEGDLWFESDTGTLFIYYDSTWVDLSGGGGSDVSQYFDAKGDILVGTGNSSFDNLQLGPNGTFLQANSSASAGVQWANIPTINYLDDIGDVSVSTPSSGDFLKWNGSAWVNDVINLGTDTEGNYVSDLTGGTGVSITHTPGEGSSAQVAIGQDVDISASVTFAHVSADVTGDLTGNADTASALQIARTISLTGDVSGSVSFDGAGDATITATIQPNSVALGTDTTGNYVNDITAGTGVTVTHTPGEGSSPTVAIGQAVSTSSSVTFAHVASDVTGNVTGNLTGNASTASTLETARIIGLSGDVSGSASFDGSSNVNIFTTVNTSSVAITELDGINISNPEQYQTLVYDGSEWINEYPTTVSLVNNAEATTLQVGEAVYLFGGTGNHASVKRADNDGDATSAKTVGLVAQAIPSGGNGPVVTRGYVAGMDLSSGYSAGDTLYLGEDGGFTTTKPHAPEHLVYIGVVVRATNNGIIYVAAQNGYELDEIHDVDLVTNAPVSGDFLKYNGTLWVNDQINLGTDTVGDYVQSLVAGTGVTLSNNSGEGSTPTVAIGQDVGTSASVVFGFVETTGDLVIGGDVYVSGSVVTENQVSLTLDDPFIYLNGGSEATNPDLGIAGNYNDGTYAHAGIFRDATDGKWKFFDSYTPEPTNPINVGHASYSPAPVVAETFESTVSTGTAPLTVSSTTEVTNLHSDTATSLHNSRAISLGGDLSGSVSFDGSADVTITATIQPNSVALGTDTTGNYMVDLTEGTGVTIVHTPGEASNATISIGQPVATSSSVTFAAVTAPVIGNVTGNASTASALQTPQTISLTGDVSGSVSFDGSTGASITATIQPNSVALGTDTTGNYMSEISGGTGISVTHTPGEGSSASVSLNATLDDLSDVSVSSPTLDDVLKWNGSIWTSASVSAGGSNVTVSDTPPSTPAAGDLWFESDSARTYIYYDSSWIEVGALAPSAIVSDTAPSSPEAGQLWFNSLNGGTYIYYDSVWTEVGAVPVNALLNTINAKGDLLVGTADNTVGRLPVGTNGYFLKANSSASAGIEWASIPTINALDDVGDVNVTSATSGQYLQWNGTNWVAATVSTDFMTSTKNAALIVMDIGA